MYGYISWWRGNARWTPDKIAAKDAWYPKTPTRVEKITSRKQAERWWDAVMHYFISRPTIGS